MAYGFVFDPVDFDGIRFRLKGEALNLISYKIYNSRHFANDIELYTQLGIY